MIWYVFVPTATKFVMNRDDGIHIQGIRVVQVWSLPIVFVRIVWPFASEKYRNLFCPTKTPSFELLRLFFMLRYTGLPKPGVFDSQRLMRVIPGV